jgi:uncharacterized protein (TIGR02679 family)
LLRTEGQPTTAARLFLNLFRSTRVRFIHHGDFDWPGIRIANLILRRHQAASWRMPANSYLAAPDGACMKGTPVAASWDANLEHAMMERGRSVREEPVLDILLVDLTRQETLP